jgi:hypothetical protein
MKHIVVALSLFMLSELSFAQGTTENAKGESSILFRGISLDLNVGDAELNFGLNNLTSTIGKNHAPIYGVSITAKNEEGLGTLFSEGDLVPSGRGSMFLGYSFSNGTNINCEEIRNRILRRYNNFLQSVLPLYKAEMLPAIAQATRDSAADMQFLQKTLTDKLDKITIVSELRLLLANVSGERPEVTEAKKIIQERHDNFVKKMNEKQVNLENELSIATKASCTSPYRQLIVFAFGERNGMSFKRFVGFDPTDYSKTTTDENFNGGKAGLGLNAQSRNLMFGITFARGTTNNFSLLTKKEYTLRATKPEVNGQIIVEEKKVTAYSGEYSELSINNIQADFICNLALDKEKTNHLLINPYVTAQFKSSKKDLLPNATDVGCGFYFFQKSGKFMGGFFVEVPDVKNNYEKAKPVEDQNLREPLKRLSFGVVGKFSISGFLNMF